MIVVLDLLFKLCLGIGFALCARDRVRVDGPFATPAFILVLAFTGIVVLPMTLYLYVAYTAWSWLYLVDPANVPGLAVIPLMVLHGGFLVGGWYLGARLLRADKHQAAGLITLTSGVMFLIAVVLLSGRLGSYGSYRDFADGRTYGLLEVKLGYVLITLMMGVGVAAVFVALELIRDSRRVRAR